jgi:hypothetical protein
MKYASKTLLLVSVILLIGTISGTSTKNVFADDSSENKVMIHDSTQQTNSCDETEEGTNDAQCQVERTLNIGEISIGTGHHAPLP